MTGVKAVAPRVSYADLEGWPEDGRRYELYDGDVFVIPSPISLHQLVLARLYLALEGYTRAHGGVVLFAPLDVVLTDFDVVQPDLLLFTQSRRHLVDPRSVIHYAPDLAIEILSPGTATNDRGRKMRLLEQHGVQEYWLVDPKLITVEIYRLADARLVPWSRAEGSQPIDSALLPALSLVPHDLVSFG